MANELSDLIYCATEWVFTHYLILLVSMTIVDNKCFIDFYAVIDSIVISEKNVLLLVCSTLFFAIIYISINETSSRNRSICQTMSLFRYLIGIRIMIS